MNKLKKRRWVKSPIPYTLIIYHCSSIIDPWSLNLYLVPSYHFLVPSFQFLVYSSQFSIFSSQSPVPCSLIPVPCSLFSFPWSLINDTWKILNPDFLHKYCQNHYKLENKSSQTLQFCIFWYILHDIDVLFWSRSLFQSFHIFFTNSKLKYVPSQCQTTLH